MASSAVAGWVTPVGDLVQQLPVWMLYCDDVGVALQEAAEPNGAEHKSWNRFIGCAILLEDRHKLLEARDLRSGGEGSKPHQERCLAGELDVGAMAVHTPINPAPEMELRTCAFV